MLIRNMMISTVWTVSLDGKMGKALDLMRERHLRVLPVVDGENRICGILTAINILRHILPEYIESGDLADVAFAPDIHSLARRYPQMIALTVEEVMDTEPLIVPEDESLLAVATTLVTDAGRHVCALVTDSERHLRGIVSPGDILDYFQRLQAE